MRNFLGYNDVKMPFFHRVLSAPNEEYRGDGVFSAQMGLGSHTSMANLKCDPISYSIFQVSNLLNRTVGFRTSPAFVVLNHSSDPLQH